MKEIQETACRRFQRLGFWGDAAWIGSIVFLAALFGIYTRPIGSLAALWPANALLMGILIRNPRLAFPAGLVGAFSGFVAADLITGGGRSPDILADCGQSLLRLYRLLPVPSFVP